MRQVFRDLEHEKMFRESGYFKLQLLDSDDLAHCLALFEQVDPKVDQTFYSSIDSRDVTYRKMVDQRLRDRLQQKIECFFIDYYPIAFTFIVKRPGPGGEVKMHVDDIHVDPEKYPSINIWCPLIDTNPENGGLSVLPKSHLLPFPQRGLGLPFPYSAYMDLVTDKFVFIPLKAGEAVFYHDQLIHGSSANQSKDIRPALITGLIPKEAEPIIYFRYPGMAENQCERFQVAGDFWFEFDKQKRPDNLLSKGIEAYHPVELTEEAFFNILEL